MAMGRVETLLMDIVLLILACSEKAMLASEIGSLAGLQPGSVRGALNQLLADGLAAKTQVGTKGPLGTFRWNATESGKACVAELRAWIRSRP